LAVHPYSFGFLRPTSTFRHRASYPWSAISRLYASEYPQDVSGLVLVDYTPYEMRSGLTHEEWHLWLTTPISGNLSEEALALYPDCF
jgi:pimeloyl-ACP methyl ester carboxylesterase